MSELQYDGPVMLVVMDGVGLNSDVEGNAVLTARTDFLDEAMLKYPVMALEASGEAVGILPGQMGNSEVGHNALGAGQIIKQGIARIEEQFETGEIWESAAWKGAIENVKKTGGVLHFSGIFSDGGVHSDIRHLFKMLKRASEEGIRRARVHLVLDGRDVPPQSAEKYIKSLLDFIQELGEEDYKIASGGGRMVFVADRYEADWAIVKAGWDAFVWGRASREFESALDAVKTFRAEDPELQDQYVPSFVIVENGEPVGRVQDGDSFIYYDFRADRAIEIAQAFTYNDFPYFDRGTENNRRLDVYFAGMMEYNSDTHVPEHQLVPAGEIRNTLHQFLGENRVSQLAVAETVKFGHITYYFNGNSYETYDFEENVNVPSDTRPFNERPWMKSAEITDAVLDRLGAENCPRFVRVNFAGGDMVGHFGDFEATVAAMEAIDIQLARLARRVDELGGVMIITADHGNAEELIDHETMQPKTAHSTNLVPCIFYDNTENAKKYKLRPAGEIEGGPGLSNVAATVANMLGFSKLPESWRESLIRATE